MVLVGSAGLRTEPTSGRSLRQWVVRFDLEINDPSVQQAWCMKHCGAPNDNDLSFFFKCSLAFNQHSNPQSSS